MGGNPHTEATHSGDLCRWPGAVAGKEPAGVDTACVRCRRDAIRARDGVTGFPLRHRELAYSASTGDVLLEQAGRFACQAQTLSKRHGLTYTVHHAWVSSAASGARP
jgi:hypothetical protein